MPNSCHGCAMKIGPSEYEYENHFLKQLRNKRCCKNECIHRIPNGSLANGWYMIKSKHENERREFVLNSMESNAVINRSDNTKERIFLYMKFDGIEVFQNAWYLAFCIPRATFFHYRMKFINNDIRSVNGNIGSTQPRPNTLGTITSLRKIVN